MLITVVTFGLKLAQLALQLSGPDCEPRDQMGVDVDTTSTGALEPEEPGIAG